MKKLVLTLLSFVLFAAIGCSHKKEYSSEQGFLNAWGTAIKNRDYSLYSKYEAYPKTVDQFNEIYRDYYFSDINVIDIGSPSDPLKNSDNEMYIKKEASISGFVVSRKDQKKFPFTGKIDFISRESRKDVWMIANRIIVRSE
jgi:hypothetical protein